MRKVNPTPACGLIQTFGRIGYNMLEQHPLSAAFPAMTPEEFRSFKDSINIIGVQNPIVTFDGMVLDGWHRYCAAMELDVECPTTLLLENVNPRDYVLAQNKERRHLSQGQWAIVVARVYECELQHGPGRPQKNSATVAELTEKVNCDNDLEVKNKKVSVAKVAAKEGISQRTLERSKKVNDAGLGDAVLAGKVTLAQAEKIAELPEKQREDAIEKPAKKKSRVSKKSKEPEPKTVEQLEDAKKLDEAFEGIDIDKVAKDDYNELLAENNELQSLIEAIKADDQKAEIVKWHKISDNANRERDKYMDLLQKTKNREAWNRKQLMRCGKAIGESDPDKVAPAVEAFCRLHKKAAV